MLNYKLNIIECLKFVCESVEVKNKISFCKKKVLIIFMCN